MSNKFKIKHLRYIVIIIFCLGIGLLLSFKLTTKKEVKKQDIMGYDHLLKDKETQAVVKHFEKEGYSDGKLQYKLVAEFATFSPTADKRLYTLENILPETVFYDSAEGKYNMTAARGELDELTSNAFIEGNIKVTSDDGLLFETGSIKYLGKEKYLESDDRFYISGTDIHLEGLGFKINLEKKTVEMNHLVKTNLKGSKDLMQAEDIESFRDLILMDSSKNKRIYIESDKFRYDDSEGIVTYSDNVFITNDQLVLRCDILDIHLNQDRSRFEKFHLYGNLIFNAEKDLIQGTCKEMIYYINEGRAEFFGYPVIWSILEQISPENYQNRFNQSELIFDIPMIQNRFPFYPYIQRRISQFNPNLHAKQQSAFDFLIKNILVLIADRALSGDSMFYDGKSFIVKGNAKLNYSLTGTNKSMILDTPKDGDIREDIGVLTITSDNLNYNLNNQQVTFQGNVDVNKGLDSIRSDRLSIKLDKHEEGIQEFTFKDNIKTTILLASDELDKIVGGKEDSYNRPENDLTELHISSNELHYITAENSLEYKDNVEIFFEKSFLLCDRLLIVQNEETQELEKMIATGDVRSKNNETVFSGENGEFIKDDNMMHLYGQPKVWLKDNTVTGDDIYYYLTEDIYRVEGNVSTIYYLPEKIEEQRDNNFNFNMKSGSILITSEILIFNASEQHAEFINNVKVENEDFELRARNVKLFVDESRYGIEKILAQDDVRIQSEEYVGLGDYALYIDKLQKIILWGSSKIYETDKVISSGKEITFLLNQNKVQIDSNDSERVKTTLFIKSDEDFINYYKKKK